MIAIFQDMLETSMEVFMDDFSVFGDSFDSCLTNLEQMLIRCKQAHLVLNWEKCHFMVTEGIVLGHKVSSKGLEGFAAALAVLVTGASQSRQHESHHRFFPVDTSLIHIESRKSPTKSLFDVGSRRISIFTVNTKEYYSDVLAIITRIMRRT
ncbi:hypothetical protein Tco_1259861 [Tanacetum coccineum]